MAVMTTQTQEVTSEESTEPSTQAFPVTSDYSTSDHTEAMTGTRNEVQTTSSLGLTEADSPEPSTRVEAHGPSSSFSSPSSSTSSSPSSSPPLPSTATSPARTMVSRQRDARSTSSNVDVVPAATTELLMGAATTQSTDSMEHQVSSTTEPHLDPNSTISTEPFSSLPASSTSVLYPELSHPLAWEEWTYWSQCSATCGQGSRLRWKLCQNDNNDTATCDVEMGRGISE